MKGRKSIIALGLASMVFMLACNWFSPTYEEINPEGFYLLKVPSYLSPTQGLNEDAPVQFQNLDQDIYVIIRTNPLDSLQGKFPEDRAEDFFELHMDNLYEKLENPVIKGPDTLENPYYRVLRGQIRGEYKGNSLTHQLIIYQDSSHLYQMLQWMPSGSWKEYRQDMELMVQSFRPEN